jgi:hypothetical protein
MRIDRNLNALITHAIEVAEYLIVDTQIEEITPCFLLPNKTGRGFCLRLRVARSGREVPVGAGFPRSLSGGRL